MASGAHTSEVRAEATRKLDIIATEQKNYEAAKNDIAGLTEFLATPCQACLVREEGQKQLEKLNAAREQSDEESLKTADYNKTTLMRLASGAHSPEVRAEAGNRLNIIAQDEESLKSADDDKTKLTHLASGAHSPEVRTEAGNRLNMLGEIRRRLYELKFDIDRVDGQGNDLRQAISDFEIMSKMAETGKPTAELLRRLREAGALKPWGAIVYAHEGGKWGMSALQETRQAAVASARERCRNPERCLVEISFFGTGCGALAHSNSSWGIAASNSIEQAKEMALSDCRKASRSCRIVAAVCAADRSVTSHDKE